MMIKKLVVFILFMFSVTTFALAQRKNISVHDPCIIKSDGVYHIFCTGMGITHWYSTDLTHWIKADQVFQEAPAWTQKVVPGFNNHIWAPDISYYNGKYYLYYSVSAFERNT